MLKNIFKAYQYSERVVPHMVKWVKLYMKFASDLNCSIREETCLQEFRESLSQRFETWQVSQAEEAVKVFLFHNQEKLRVDFTPEAKQCWRAV